MGRRDLPLAPSPQTGFEMVLLRMLFFSPEKDALSLAPPEKKQQAKANDNLTLKPDTKTHSVQDASWGEVLERLNLTGITRILASYCVVKAMTDTHIYLLLDPAQTLLLDEKQRERLEQALTNFYGISRKLEISTGSDDVLVSSPAAVQKEQREKQHQAALASVQKDPQVQMILQTFDASLSPENVKAV
jgi:DNA polymerase-3 subunit gamma/tau